MKPIPFAPDYYATETGEIWSTKHGYLKQLKPWLTNKGYKIVGLHPGYGTKGKRYLVHRLVLITYSPPDFDYSGLEARHKNGIISDCRIENLEWGTHWDNMQDSIRHGTHPSLKLQPNRARGETHGWRKHPESIPRGTRTRQAKLTEEQVLEIKSALSCGEKKLRLARKYNVSRRAIRNIADGISWKHV